MSSAQQILLALSKKSIVPTTWNPSDKGDDVTLTLGNLRARSSNTDTGNNGVRSVASNTEGKYYFEAVILGAENTYIGISNSTWNLTTTMSDASGTVTYDPTNGQIRQSTVLKTAATAAVGNTLGFAIDLTDNKIWVRVNNGNWNNDGSANPETGTNGAIFTSLGTTFVACDTIGSTGVGYTANFGATAFTYTVPSGFNQGFGT